jgi:hypothetical protein
MVGQIEQITITEGGQRAAADYYLPTYVIGYSVSDKRLDNSSS